MLYTLIGDLVGSRGLPDRAAAQDELGRAMSEVSRHVRHRQSLEPTVGDELQGAYATLGEATRAALELRLELLPGMDVRCGIGLGEVTVHDAVRRPLLQDGPGWWAARDALDRLGTRRFAARRTWAELSDVAATAQANAYLTARDALVDRLGDRGRRLLLASLRGSSQQEIAAAEGISRSAVSQQFARGVGAVREAQDLMDAVGS